MPDSGILSVSGVHLPGRIVREIQAQVQAAAAQSGDAYGVLLGSALGNEFRVETILPGEMTSPNAIGFYRSHRHPGLQPFEADATLVRRLFPAGRSLLLLIKPLSANESVAAFFRCENGVILETETASQEFPFVAAVEQPPEARPSKAGRWLVPSAIAAGMAAALLIHCSSPRTDENPVTAIPAYPINSSSDAPAAKPSGARPASSTTGKLWPSRSAKQAHQTR